MGFSLFQIRLAVRIGEMFLEKMMVAEEIYGNTVYIERYMTVMVQDIKGSWWLPTPVTHRVNNRREISLWCDEC